MLKASLSNFIETHEALYAGSSVAQCLFELIVEDVQNGLVPTPCAHSCFDAYCQATE